MSEHGGKPDDGPRHDEKHGHRQHTAPYFEPDYARPLEHGHKPPDNPRYPDPRIYGSYASKRPPHYVPHTFEHTWFRPRKEDYKPPTTCDGEDGDAELCVRKDHRTLTVDERDR